MSVSWLVARQRSEAPAVNPRFVRPGDADIVARVEQALGSPGAFAKLEQQVAKSIAETLDSRIIPRELRAMGLPPPLAAEMLDYVRRSPSGRRLMASKCGTRTVWGVVIFWGGAILSYSTGDYRLAAHVLATGLVWGLVGVIGWMRWRS